MAMINLYEMSYPTLAIFPKIPASEAVTKNAPDRYLLEASKLERKQDPG